MSLPPILPAAATRAQPRKPAATRKAAPPPAQEKLPRKPRVAPPERAGPFSSSWPCAALQRQLPRSPAPPQPRGRSWESLCAAAGPEPEAGAGEAALRFSLSLPPEAARVLQRRSLEKQRGRPCPSPGGGPERLLPSARSKAAPAAGGSARRGARAAPGSGPGGDLRALLKISLLNERHRYDDVEYEEEEAAAPGAALDEGLVRKCTEWLRGVESAAGRDRADKLETLPHLGAL
ncbi:proline-rich protein 18 [Emydura macquarii macquarii]|uniref:proline-rich protein 18 n=1 Tax=Emydura macquarii macquarii TaxID=1129001 RepID=UPI00352A58B9